MSNAPGPRMVVENQTFKDFARIVGDGFELELANTFVLKKDNILGYEFSIKIAGEDAGTCSVIIESDFEKIAEFGNFGITVNPKFLGIKLPSKTAKACYIIFKGLGQNKLFLTHDEDNQSIERACLELGAKYLETLKFEDGRVSKKRYIISL
jgi:hypothetical protein